jgi:hypothetical protein
VTGLAQKLRLSCPSGSVTHSTPSITCTWMRAEAAGQALVFVAVRVLTSSRQAVVFLPTAFSIHAPPAMMPPKLGCDTLSATVTCASIVPVRESSRAM